MDCYGYPYNINSFFGALGGAMGAGVGAFNHRALGARAMLRNGARVGLVYMTRVGLGYAVFCVATSAAGTAIATLKDKQSAAEAEYAQCGLGHE